MSFISVNNAGKLVVSCPYESRNKVKSAGGKWDPVLKKWVLAFTPGTVEAVIDAVPNPEVHPDVEKKLVESIEKERKLRKLRAMAREDHPVMMKVPGLRGRLYNYQKLGVMFSLVNGRGVLIADEMGLGKENPVDMPVLTIDGWRPIGSLKVGDSIYGGDGKSYAVTGVFPQGLKEIVRVRFSDGVVSECGWEHLWRVQSENDFRRQKGWRVVDTKTLSNDLFHGRKRKRSKWRIPLVEPVEYPEADLLIPPYLMGVLLGDGSLTNSGVTFVPGDAEVPRIVDSFLPKGYRVSKNADYGSSTRYGVVFDGFGNPMSVQLSEYGILVTGEFKFVPDDYKYASVEQRKRLLAGLLDTDGTVKGARTRFSSTSERLADDVVYLVKSLGGMAVKCFVKGQMRNRNGANKKELDCWQVTVRTFFNPFLRDSNRVKWKRSSKLVRNIVSIEPVRVSEAVCISVNSPDSTYVIEDFVVTHNTLQGIATALCLKERGEVEHVLIVVPPSLKFNWALEIEKWTTEPYVVIDGTPDERVARWLRKNVFFYVVNFELLLEDLFGGREYKPKKNETKEQKADREKRMAVTRKRAKILAPIRERLWGMIVVDEAQALKNGLSKRSMNVRSLRGKFRMALTGTPLDGRLEELYSVMEFVSPGLLGSRTRFMQRHAETDFFGKVVKYRRIGEVREKITPHFIRRLKKDVLKDLPDKVYSNRMVEMSSSEKKVYRELAENGHSATEDTAALVAVIRCKQFCDNPRLVADALEKGEDPDEKEIKKLRKMKSSKMEAMREILQEVVVDNAHKVLVFSQYAEMVKLLMEVFDEMGLKYLCIWGDTDKKLRADYQEKFNTDKTIDIMVGTEAMSTGLNFTSADYVINYDDNWAPAFMAQREDRCIVEGQYVQSFDGMKKIENVEIGDLVLTRGGTYEKVVDTGSRLHRSNTTGGLTTKIYYKRFNYPLECTHDHRVLVLRGDKVDWMEASDVRPRDMLLSPVVSGERVRPGCVEFPERLSFATEQTLNGSVPFVNGRYRPLPRVISVDDDFLFMVGWYLAEGFSSTSEGKGKFVSFSGHRLESPELERIKVYFENFGLTATIGPVIKNALELRVYSSELACWFEELFGVDAYSKRIPHEWIEKWDVGSLVRILDAYRQGDGYCRNKQNEWVTASHLLALQTLKISEMDGFQPTMSQVKNGKNKGHWICCFTKNGNPCSPLLRKRLEGFVCLPVTAVETFIETSKKKRVHDLTIENDESFVVGRATVHNCHRIGQKNVVNVINFICVDTIEERIRSVLYHKSKISAQALGDDLDEMVLKRLGPQDTARLL